MKVKNLEIGLRVQVKAKNHVGFFSENAGKFGTILDIDDGTYLDVKVKYDDGIVEWGNHDGIKRANKGLSSVSDLKVGDRVEILHKRLTAFFYSNKGRIGTVTHLDPDSTLDVRVEFADGDTDWGNHSDIRVVTEPNSIEVGTRVRLVKDDMFGFLKGDTGTVKYIASDDSLVVHFDVARHGWDSEEYGIPDNHGLWVSRDSLEIITD